MSDTTAFLSGCAITGVAAVLMLGGGFAVGQYRNNSPPNSLPTVPVQSLPTLPNAASPIPVPPPYPNSFPGSSNDPQLLRDLEQQRGETTALKSQVEDLKAQIEQQRTEMQRLTAQLQAQQDTLTTLATRPERGGGSLNGSGQSQTLLMGVVGFGFIVVLAGGGAILIGVIVLIMQSQRRSSNRPVQVIHPVPPTYAFSDQEFLPPMRPRRARQINYYED